MVEVRGIEPLSATISDKASPGAVTYQFSRADESDDKEPVGKLHSYIPMAKLRPER